MTPDRDVAIVLSDGGAKGAYEVGVIKALVQGAAPTTGYRPIEPGTYTGTSVGGYNACVMASQPDVPATATVDFLESAWRQRIANTATTCGNGVYRVRGLPLQGLDPGCLLHPFSTVAHTATDSIFLAAQALRSGVELVATPGSLVQRVAQTADVSLFFDTEPFSRLIHDTVSFDGLRRSGRSVAVAATDWDRGAVRVFEKDELASEIGHLAIQASAAIPGLFRPVTIGTTDFVDGALLMSTPLKPAIRAGAETLHVVFLDPLVRDSDLGSGSTVDALVRSYMIMTAARVRYDLEVARRVNRAIEILARLERGEAISDEPEVMRSLGNLESVVRRRRQGPRRRPLTLHVYRPESDLGVGSDLLNFEIRHVERLIEQGYRDAVSHDCERAGCSLPADAEPPRATGHVRTARSRRGFHA